MYIDPYCNTMIWCPDPKNATLMVHVLHQSFHEATLGRGNNTSLHPAIPNSYPVLLGFISFAVLVLWDPNHLQSLDEDPVFSPGAKSDFSLLALVKGCQGKFDRFRQDKHCLVCKKTRCLYTHDCCISMAQNLSAIRIYIETQLILVIAQFYLKSVANATNHGDLWLWQEWFGGPGSAQERIADVCHLLASL